ncbi:MAG: HAMP domain-containing histidine kinase [Thermoleophilia bacterium]|nr:HAMP domain-containing histidine kinase [Thermoleophilia bacterium]
MFGATRRLSASARVALAVTVVLALGSLLLTGLGYLLLSKRLADDMDRTLRQESSAYVATIHAAPAQTTAELQEATRVYLGERTAGGPDAATFLLVRFVDGKVISNSNVRLEDAPANAPALDPAAAQPGFATFMYQEKEYRVATVPVLDANNNTIAVFQAAMSVEPNEAMGTALVRILLIAGLLVILVGASLSAWVARASLRPLHQVARTTQAITQTSLSRRVPYTGPHDDVGMMVSALNEMLDRLESAFAEQKHFTADASHELRTPLTIIRGHLEVMRYEGELTPSQEESMLLVLDEVERMSRLVNDLLALSRLDAGVAKPFAPLDLSRIAQESVSRVEGMAGRRFTFASPGPLPVRGDHDMLLQALLNLLSNAVTATGEDGSISVRCEGGAGVARVHVQDDGPGIHSQDLDRVFDRFYRVPDSGRTDDTGGSGLGLAIASRMVQRHGGRLTARNAPEGGAVFTMELPLRPRALRLPGRRHTVRNRRIARQT